MPPRSQAPRWAVIGFLAAAAGQFALVYGLYGGAWSALFYTGADTLVPPALASENIRRAPDSIGFDGQYYHFIAHDPLILGDTKAYVDNPPLRWRRILLPVLAYTAGLGRPRAVDFAYFVLILGATVLGVLWLSRYAGECGLPQAVGLAFLLLPATMISLERMTVDVALAALAVLFAAVAERKPAHPPPYFYAVLVLAPLARETGVVCAGAWAIVEVGRRRFGAAFAAAATLIPLALWSIYVRLRTGADATAWFGVPFAGLVGRTLDPFPTPTPSLGLKLAAGLEYLAILGVWIAIVLVVRWILSDPHDPAAIASALLLALFAFLSKADIWLEAYGFARTLSPVFLWLAMAAMKRRRWILTLPWALVAPRILYQAALLVRTIQAQ